MQNGSWEDEPDDPPPPFEQAGEQRAEQQQQQPEQASFETAADLDPPGTAVAVGLAKKVAVAAENVGATTRRSAGNAHGSPTTTTRGGGSAGGGSLLSGGERFAVWAAKDWGGHPLSHEMKDKIRKGDALWTMSLEGVLIGEDGNHFFCR